jgi:hypothetical protein
MEAWRQTRSRTAPGYGSLVSVPAPQIDSDIRRRFWSFKIISRDRRGHPGKPGAGDSVKRTTTWVWSPWFQEQSIPERAHKIRLDSRVNPCDPKRHRYLRPRWNAKRNIGPNYIDNHSLSSDPIWRQRNFLAATNADATGSVTGNSAFTNGRKYASNVCSSLSVIDQCGRLRARGPHRLVPTSDRHGRPACD